MGMKRTVTTLLCACAVPLLAMPQYRAYGWALWVGLVTACVLLRASSFGRDMILLAFAVGLLGLIPINTDISYGHMAVMGAVMVATVAVPYVVTRRFYHEPVVQFPFRGVHTWGARHIGYIIFAAVASYLLLPFYLTDTGSYLNWQAVPDPSHIIRLFIGTNALGIWDEVFFVGVCLAILRKHLSFWWANAAQAALWTTFLYELGFRGWGAIVIFFFALSQGYIFTRGKSFLYIIAVHLTIDFMLFLVLIHLHNPHLLRFFVTSPL